MSAKSLLLYVALAMVVGLLGCEPDGTPTSVRGGETDYVQTAGENCIKSAMEDKGSTYCRVDAMCSGLYGELRTFFSRYSFNMSTINVSCNRPRSGGRSMQCDASSGSFDFEITFNFRRSTEEACNAYGACSEVETIRLCASSSDYSVN